MRVQLRGFTEDVGSFVNSLKWQSECIDPDRPGWLPTWIPTLSEKACQFGMYQNQTTPPAPPMVHIAAPQSVSQMTRANQWTPEMAAQQTRVEYVDDVNQTIDSYLTDTAAQRQKENEQSGTKAILLVALIGVVGVLIAARK